VADEELRETVIKQYRDAVAGLEITEQTLDLVEKQRDQQLEELRAWETILRRREWIDEVDVYAETLRSARTSAMPPRQPGFESLTVSQAIEEVAGLLTGQLHADVFAKEIWVISDVDQLRRVKNTLNTELVRAVNRGVLKRVGRNVFVSSEE